LKKPNPNSSWNSWRDESFAITFEMGTPMPGIRLVAIPNDDIFFDLDARTLTVAEVQARL
jgi:hypothetical protein